MNYGFFPFRSGDPCGAAPPYPPCDGMLRARKKAAQADTASAAVPSWERTRGMPAIRSPLIFCNFYLSDAVWRFRAADVRKSPSRTHGEASQRSFLSLIHPNRKKFKISAAQRRHIFVFNYIIIYYF